MAEKSQQNRIFVDLCHSFGFFKELYVLEQVWWVGAGADGAKLRSPMSIC